MLEGIIAYIGIGSNLNDPVRQCCKAIQMLAGYTGIALQRVSTFYKTEPVNDSDELSRDPQNQPWFINAVAEIRTTLPPGKLLGALQDIENQMGRRRDYKGAPRTIDLDLLLYGQEVITDGGVTVPHPRMHKRRFVLEPLCEIASYIIHPAFGVSMKGLKERLEDEKAVEKYRE
jgi:2-amino-4-hydroxy-6-hydroxymethyldihydropteridine diphosphokinase